MYIRGLVEPGVELLPDGGDALEVECLELPLKLVHQRVQGAADGVALHVLRGQLEVVENLGIVHYVCVCIYIYIYIHTYIHIINT